VDVNVWLGYQMP